MTGPGSIEASAAPPRPAPDTDLQLKILSSQAGVIGLVVDSGGGYPFYPERTLEVPRGTFSAGAPLRGGGGMVHRLRIDLPEGLRLCVREARLGSWIPA